jgi:hypothetical protein
MSTCIRNWECRLNGEIKRRTEVVGIQRARYITLESVAPVSDDPLVGLPTAAA